MRLIDADSLKKRLIRQRDKICEQRKYGWEWTQDGLNAAIMQIGCEMVENPIEERKQKMEQPNVIIAEGYDSIKSEDGETGFGIYDPENKQIFIAGAVPDEIFVKALLHELMHWVQDISGYAFNEDEANAFAENIYNTMESYIVTSRWTPCKVRMPEEGSWAIWCSNKGSIQVARWKIDAWDHFFPDQGFFELEDAVAWMPLPEPYTERREE